MLLVLGFAEMEMSIFEIMSALLIALLKFWIEFAVMDSISIYLDL